MVVGVGGPHHRASMAGPMSGMVGGWTYESQIWAGPQETPFDGWSYAGQEHEPGGTGGPFLSGTRRTGDRQGREGYIENAHQDTLLGSKLGVDKDKR